MESTPKLALMHEVHCIDQGSDLKVPSTTGHVSAFVQRQLIKLLSELIVFGHNFSRDKQ